MDTADTDEHSAGNTKIARCRSRCWFFTWNNPDNEHTFISLLEFAGVSKYVFQLEKGESGTLHFQGLIYFENARDFKSIKSINPKIHFEVCKDLRKAIKYCCKLETRVKGPWVKGIELPKEMDLITDFKPWQANIINIVTNTIPDKRTIYWYCDYVGNTGKTALAKYLCVKHKALYVSGKSSDVKYAVSKWLQSGRELTCVIWDVPRTSMDYLSYEAIESIKNGIFFTSKYESKMEIFNPPHIICFANKLPKIDALSADRWTIVELNKDPSLIPDDYL